MIFHLSLNSICRYIIFFGDFNYRIDTLEKDAIKSLIETQDYQSLLANDQVSNFCLLIEGELFSWKSELFWLRSFLHQWFETSANKNSNTVFKHISKFRVFGKKKRRHLSSFNCCSFVNVWFCRKIRVNV